MSVVPIVWEGSAHTASGGADAVVAMWLKAVAEKVAEGEPVVEIETDKVLVSVSAPCSGRLLEQSMAAEELVAQGETLGLITRDE